MFATERCLDTKQDPVHAPIDGIKLSVVASRAVLVGITVRRTGNSACRAHGRAGRRTRLARRF